MPAEELRAAGLNDSVTHVDFMFGSAETDIDGLLPGGGREPLVRAGEGELTDDGLVRLTQQTSLRAFNLNAGVVHSWKKLLPRPHPLGATLTHIRTLTDEKGRVTGYITVAPTEAMPSSSP